MATAEIQSALKERELMLQHLREETARSEEEINILSAAARLLDQASASGNLRPEPVLAKTGTGSGDIRKAFP